MIDPKLYEGWKVIKVVQWLEVELLTGQGWRLLQTVHMDSEGSNYNNDNHSYYTYPIRSTMFVLGINDETLSVHHTLAQTSQKNKELETNLKEMQRSREKDRFALQDLEKDRDAFRDEVQPLRDKCHKLEGDIGKIEAEIGGARMREILNREGK